ncbi:Dyp-type peroxidase [Streptomyces sp. NPDC002039]|uniref:Dyp-type peroxidase n=1 Tax=Streptomyces sp. NPDC002039 TaxID=3154660 RepID=UPI0033271023
MVSLDLDVFSGRDQVALLQELSAEVERVAHGVGECVMALGASVFKQSRVRPRHLTEMPSFAGDVLDPRQVHGDVLLQFGGASLAHVVRPAEEILSGSRHWRLRWQSSGFRWGNRKSGGRALADNPFRFTEGFGNPVADGEASDRAIVRAGQQEPDWAVGGSYQVVRIIRFATELWDKDPIGEQERIIGRRRNGRWLDGTPADERANFSADPQGSVTPLDAHVRRAAPDPRNHPEIVRRSYSYDLGGGDRGLVFTCFQRDLANGFEAIQKRLEGESMSKYILTTGGGYFFIPPPGNRWIEAIAQNA